MRFWITTYLISYAFISNSQVPTPDHVVIVIFENRSYYDIIEDPNFVPPYINSLAKDPSYGVLFTNSHAITHPSQPNYLHLFSGSDQGVTDDDTSADAPFSTSNLGANLISAGLTFIGYSEDLPHTGFTGDSTTSTSPPYLGLYARKHSPWVNWQGNQTNGINPSHNQPFSNFPTDYSTLPTVSFVIPNMDHDMHNLGRTVADNWLKANLDGYVQWLKNNNSLLILTWDEDDYSDNNHIPTIFFGPMVNPGLYDEGASGITHHNVLRTIEDMYGISHSGNAANVSPITDVWLTVTPIQLTSFLASADESDIILNWSTASELNNDFFTIENSINGTSFKKIESVKGAGTTSEHHHYEYIHKNPFIGKSYYRLKQTDFNGKYSYSKIISVQFKPSDEGSVVIYPNPSDGQSIHLQLKNMDADDLQIDLINMLGQRIETQAIKPIGSEETIITLKPTQPLPEGIYIVKVADLPSQKLVVK